MTALAPPQETAYGNLKVATDGNAQKQGYALHVLRTHKIVIGRMET